MSNENISLKLIDCRPVNDLMALFGLSEGVDYDTLVSDNGIKYHNINLKTKVSIALNEAVKDLNIFIPRAGFYLSDMIKMKKMPNQKVVDLLNLFDLIDIFDPCLHKAKLVYIQKHFLQ